MYVCVAACLIYGTRVRVCRVCRVCHLCVVCLFICVSVCVCHVCVCLSVCMPCVCICVCVMCVTFVCAMCVRGSCVSRYCGVDTELSLKVDRLLLHCHRPTVAALMALGADLANVGSAQAASDPQV